MISFQFPFGTTVDQENPVAACAFSFLFTWRVVGFRWRGYNDDCNSYTMNLFDVTGELCDRENHRNMSNESSGKNERLA